MKKLSFLLSSLMLAVVLLVSCEADNSGDNALEASNFVGFESAKTVIVNPGESKNLEAKLYATASSTERVVKLIVDAATTANPQYFSVPATVTIPAGATEVAFNVSVTGTDLDGGKSIVLRIEAQDGLDISTSYTTSINPVTGVSTTTVTSAKLTISAYSCNENLVVVNLAFDNYPEEQYYELYDSASNLISSNSDGAYAGLNLKTKREVFCLPDGDYSFILYDIYGDGMFDGTNTGNFEVAKLTAETGTKLGGGSGNFGAFQVVEFSVP